MATRERYWYKARPGENSGHTRGEDVIRDDMDMIGNNQIAKEPLPPFPVSGHLTGRGGTLGLEG